MGNWLGEIGGIFVDKKLLAEKFTHFTFFKIY